MPGAHTAVDRHSRLQERRKPPAPEPASLDLPQVAPVSLGVVHLIYPHLVPYPE